MYVKLPERPIHPPERKQLIAGRCKLCGRDIHEGEECYRERHGKEELACSDCIIYVAYAEADD
jgi:hypothetical protein